MVVVVTTLGSTQFFQGPYNPHDSTNGNIGLSQTQHKRTFSPSLDRFWSRFQGSTRHTRTRAHGATSARDLSR